jgi:predicted acyl esterase
MALFALALLVIQDGWTEVRKDIEVPMRDGKALAADLYLPPKPGKYPCVLVQTPYNKKHLGTPIAVGDDRSGEVGRGAVSDMLGFVDRKRFAYVVMDWRGFFASKAALRGVNRRTWRRGLDGYDAVEWIAQQTWSNGKVGTWGGSALGKQQFATAVEHPPHLVCCAPLIAAMGQRYEFYYDGGVYREAHTKMLDLLGFDLSRRVRESPRADMPIWRFVRNLTFRPDKIEVPCLMITGWWDHYPDEIIETFEGIVDRGGPAARAHSRLLIGPWDHVSIGLAQQGGRSFKEAAGASAQAARQFFERWLLGEKNGWEKIPRVRYWQVNEARWLETERWSSIKRETKKLQLHPDGQIGSEPGDGTRAYTYDPTNPSPTLGGANLPPLKHGPVSQEPLDRRDDVLAYATGPLETPLRINGNVTLAFDFIADRESCDFTARLCDVRDGIPWLLADAALRVRSITPGKKQRATLRFPAAAATVKDLRIYLSSSNWPRYERNTHTGADRWDEKKAKPLTVTIHHGAAELRIPEVNR